jgi:hypothetical protein
MDIANIFKRCFKIKSENNELIGRYIGDSPYQAANKALSEIIRLKEKNKEIIEYPLVFSLIEVTKGSKNKIYSYTGIREELNEPIKYKLNNNQTIEKKYKNRLRKIKVKEINTK